MLLRGPVPNFWRAPTDNDFGNRLHTRSGVWRTADETWKIRNFSVSQPALHMAISDAIGNGILFKGMPLLEVSAHHNILRDFESDGPTVGWLQQGVKSRHATDVKPRDLTSVNVDYKQMGVGGDDSWGARTHEPYRLSGREYGYSFMIIPVSAGDNLAEKGKMVIL